MEPDHIELFDAYLKGSLMPDAQLQLEQRLAQEPGLKLELEMYGLMMTAIQENRKLELKSFIARNVKVKPLPFFRSTAFFAAAAASVVFCVISYFVVYKKLSEQDTLAQHDGEAPQQEQVAGRKQDSSAPVALGSEQGKNRQAEGDKPDRADNHVTADANTDDKVALNDQKAKDAADAQARGKSINEEEITGNNNGIKVATDQMILDTFLNIDRKIYIAKPKQYQAHPDDLYAVVVTADKRRLEVQFWRSPVNYKGYRFVKNALTLYGDFEPSRTSFQELNDKVYLKYKNDYFRLSPSENFVSLIKETEPKTVSDLDGKTK